MLNLAVLKTVALLGISFVTFGGAYFPFWLKRRDSSSSSTQTIVAISHNLAGGVFVAAALMHLVPDAAGNIPLAIVLTLVTIGILFADLIESIAVPNVQEFVKGAFAKDPHNVVYVPEQAYLDDTLVSSDSLLNHIMSFQQPQDHHLAQSLIANQPSHSGCEDLCDLRSTEEEPEHLHGHTVHHHHIKVGGPGALSWLVFGLLSLHATITGAAFGMTTGVRDTVILGTVIIAHKGVESFAVAFNFMEAASSRSSAMALVLYGLMTPIGALLAVFAKQFITSDCALIVQSVLEAFAAGSFLYVGMMHLQDKTCCRKQG